MQYNRARLERRSDGEKDEVDGPIGDAASEAEHRWALRVWLHTDDPASISFDPDAEARHFGAARGEQGLGLAPDPFPDGRIEGADELEEQLV